MDLDELLSNAVLLAKQKEGEVYKVSYEEKDYVLKKRRSWPGCLEHEYRIGKALDTFRLPFFGQTYEHKVYPEYDLLLLDYLPGMTLTNLMYSGTVSHRVIAHIISEVLMIILHIQNLIAYTHYDLHCGNIIVEKRATPEIISYNFFGREHLIESHHKIWIIDHGVSHLQDIKEGVFEGNMGTIMAGAIPSVFDELFDLSVITMGYCYSYQRPNSIFNWALDLAGLKSFQGGEIEFPHFLGHENLTPKILDLLYQVDENHFHLVNNKFYFLLANPNRGITFYKTKLEELAKANLPQEEVRIYLGKIMDGLKRDFIRRRAITKEDFYKACVKALP